MRKQIKVTEKHLRKVIKDLFQGVTDHGVAKDYDQANWCGTACCVFGHAYHLAGGREKETNLLDYRSDFFDAFETKHGHKEAYKLDVLFGDPWASIGQFKKFFIKLDAKENK